MSITLTNPQIQLTQTQPIKEPEWKRFSLHWWPISKDFSYAPWERKGYIGYCISCESKLEKRKIKDFFDKHKEDTHFGKGSYCNDHFKDFGSYANISRCVWLKPHLKEDFELLMKSFSSRENVIIIRDPIDTTIISLIRGKNYAIYKNVFIDESKIILSIENIEKIDQLKVLAAILGFMVI
jgi:hypothetical protein